MALSLSGVSLSSYKNSGFQILVRRRLPGTELALIVLRCQKISGDAAAAGRRTWEVHAPVGVDVERKGGDKLPVQERFGILAKEWTNKKLF